MFLKSSNLAIDSQRMEIDQMVKVVEERFCMPYTMELRVKKRLLSFSKYHYQVFDATGNLLLQVDGGVWKFQKKRVMRDPAGLPVATLRSKTLSWKHEWVIHQGESSESKHFLCCVRRSNAMMIKNNQDVYLGNGGRDFHLSASLSSLSFKVKRGNTVIAEVRHNFTWESCKGKETFKVKVYPDVDYAFIIALLVIMNENDGP
ncbi:protein LURP-one-related 14-like isoform X3 [Hibiscus syriacus]|uniref:Protein LURP-one-related 14-like isoform X3 n=2 Tax=Hibiscus syriacus TaxID=106335 RepID=A0A6A2ZU20_HIBSY|nr:protein LURP-one-related 14-like isoform X3 [Hibiscus syriacus]